MLPVGEGTASREQSIAPLNAPLAFVEPPQLSWHFHKPFVVTRLSPEYARELTEIALQREKQITELPVARGWKGVAGANPTTARYTSYNIFLLDPKFLPLFFALRSTYRYLLAATGAPNPPRFIQAWCNIHRENQNLHRHEHSSPYIAVFSACAEGSETRYGPFPVRTEHDRVFGHRDGQIIMTVGPMNYHEVSVWHRTDSPRVTYAFDVFETAEWDPNRVLVPFDGDAFPVATPPVQTDSTAAPSAGRPA